MHAGITYKPLSYARITERALCLSTSKEEARTIEARGLSAQFVLSDVLRNVLKYNDDLFLFDEWLFSLCKLIFMSFLATRTRKAMQCFRMAR